MKTHIKKGDTVIDVGANIGFYSGMFSDLVGVEGKVYAFEPDNYNYRRLEETIKSYANIIVKKAAVSSSSGQLTVLNSAVLDFETTPTFLLTSVAPTQSA